MALNASIKTRFGTVSNYQKILTTNIDHIAYRVDIRIGLYDSQSSADDKMQPLEERNISIQFTENQIDITPEQMLEYAGVPPQVITQELIDLFNTISSFGYSLIKKSKEFSNSENV